MARGWSTLRTARDNPDQKMGVDIVRRALKAPAKQIADNAGQDGAVIVGKLLESTDIIWVHDYHFIPIAKKLRALKCTQNMGFFLHVPWPAKEILMALPDHRELVESLLEYDIIGFQTKGYVLAFMDYVVRELGGLVEPNGFIYALGKRTKVQHFPIAIETKEFSALAAKSDGSNHVKRLVTSVGDGKLMLGVDRLDYSKGLVKRFLYIYR